MTRSNEYLFVMRNRQEESGLGKMAGLSKGSRRQTQAAEPFRVPETQENSAPQNPAVQHTLRRFNKVI